MNWQRKEFLRQLIDNSRTDTAHRGHCGCMACYAWELLKALDDQECRFLGILSDEAKRQDGFRSEANRNRDVDDSQMFEHAGAVLRNLAYKIVHGKIEL